MELLSEDDLNLKDMSREELDRAWDLWFDLAQTTNDFDPPWTHGVFVLCELPPRAGETATCRGGESGREAQPSRAGKGQ